MHCEGKLKLRLHNTSYCSIEVVTKAGLTVVSCRNVPYNLHSKILDDQKFKKAVITRQNFNNVWDSLSFQVNPNSVADHAGLQAGDGILYINQVNTDQLSHEQAKMEMIRSGNEIYMTIIR